MSVTDLRQALLQALYDHPGAHATTELMELAGGVAEDWKENDVKHALDGLADANLVRWEARGDHAWVLTARGQDQLTSSRR
ncbi:MAG: hypothetical protein H0W55_09600 [Actinobacteria bacterium]|jgi:Fe2+ or Zn2+ uptake regulation protein|nr:hypothetical protein [Actinomycetota bacterium]